MFLAVSAESSYVSRKVFKKLEELAPLLGVFGFVFVSTAVISVLRGEYAVMEIGKTLMAMFFLTFGGFKVYNMEGFRGAFKSYDLLAARSDFYATVYPFLEIGLGLLFIFIVFSGSSVNLEVAAYISTIFLMGVGGVGVLNEILHGNEVPCACLGDVFNVPLTKVTLVENFGMMLMAVLMLSYTL